MNYFKDCKTIDDAKNLFNKLVFKFHPDTSGYNSQAEFIAMYKDFKAFKPTLKDSESNDFNAEDFYNLVQSFAHLQDVTITFVGSFIWIEDFIEGATKAQKESIKAIKIEGYNPARFAFKRLKWYFSPLDYSQKFKSKKTFEQIKSTYGAKTFVKQSFNQLN